MNRLWQFLSWAERNKHFCFKLFYLTEVFLRSNRIWQRFSYVQIVQIVRFCYDSLKQDEKKNYWWEQMFRSTWWKKIKKGKSVTVVFCLEFTLIESDKSRRENFPKVVEFFTHAQNLQRSSHFLNWDIISPSFSSNVYIKNWFWIREFFDNFELIFLH